MLAVFLDWEKDEVSIDDTICGLLPKRLRHFVLHIFNVGAVVTDDDIDDDASEDVAAAADDDDAGGSLVVFVGSRYPLPIGGSMAGF